MNFKIVLVLALISTVFIKAKAQTTIQISSKNASLYLGKLVKIERGDSISTYYFEREEDQNTFHELPEKLFVETEINHKKYFNLPGEITPEKAKAAAYTIDFPTVDQSAKTILIGYELKDENDAATTQNRYITPYIEIQPVEKVKASQEMFSKIGFDDALKIAKKQNKKVLLYFTAGWCGPCKWMEKYIFSDTAVLATADQNYITVKVDIDSFQGEKLRRRYNGQVIPDFFILNSKGAILKHHTGRTNKSDFIDFLTVSENSVPTMPTEAVARITKDKSLGLRLGMLHNTIENHPNTSSKIGFSAELLMGIDYNRRYLLRTGLGFVSKGIKGEAVNYLKIPVEFGYSVYKGSLFNLPGAVRFIGAPYYALRLNKKELGMTDTDYGVRFGIAPQIGDFNELEFELYYELGMKDQFKNINGFQNNTSFGINLSLSL